MVYESGNQSVPWYSAPLHVTIQVVVLNDYHIHMKYEYMVVHGCWYRVKKTVTLKKSLVKLDKYDIKYDINCTKGQLL